MMNDQKWSPLVWYLFDNLNNFWLAYGKLRTLYNVTKDTDLLVSGGNCSMEGGCDNLWSCDPATFEVIFIQNSYNKLYIVVAII